MALTIGDTAPDFDAETTEGREPIEHAFEEAGIQDRARWLEAGRPQTIEV